MIEQDGKIHRCVEKMRREKIRTELVLVRGDY